MRARYLQMTVSAEQAGRDVNSLLRRELGLSGAVLRRIKWLEDGIALDGTRVTVRTRTAPGQLLSVRLSDPEDAPQPVPTAGPLDVLWEDEDMAVVNKAAGVLVHPSHGHFDDTVGNFLMARWHAREEAAGFHPVHRLDKGTTGLLVVAKHAHGQERLKQQLHTGAFHRRYLAVCEGLPRWDEQTIDAPIAPVEGSLMKREVRADGLPARTHCKVLCRGTGRALLALTLDTGRTHQIRVHLAHAGHPLTGDFLYGTEDPDLIPRPALHSWQLALSHPITGERLTLEAPLPADLRTLMARNGLTPPA